jgi:hypothetical protein
MGKNSLIKSTAKKKTAPTKKKTVKKATTTKKAGDVKKTAPKAGAVTQPKKNAPKTGTKKAAVIKKKKFTTKDLVFKKFDVWKPKKLFKVDLDEKSLSGYTAPPVISDANEEDAQRLKTLLFKKFDFAAFPTKSAVEKDADEIRQEPLPTFADTYQPPGDTQGPDLMERTLKFFLAGFVLLIAIIIGASISNRSNYYIKTVDGAVEIWQGRFAPMGEGLLISLPGAAPPETTKAVYSENEAFLLAFNYYIEKADALLGEADMPDFKGIKLYLNKALVFATTENLRNAVHSRLNSIDAMILLYKADVASSKNTLADFKTALAYLEEASKLKLDETQAQLIKQKSLEVKDLMAALKNKQAAAEAEAKSPSTE